MPSPAPISILAQFQQQLVGNWRNLDFGTDVNGKPVGGDENPLSYNIMPLPETSDTDGYILKNFKYSEKLHFNNDNPATTLAIAARAPNRGGEVNQDARALFYEQQVKFAEGPQGPIDENGAQVVHVENGAWLFLPRYTQQPGPYPANPPGTPVSNALQQPSDMLIAKQISVPHGNSILALGTFDTQYDPNGAETWPGNSMLSGTPVIPDGIDPYPFAIKAEPDPLAPVSSLHADQRYTTLQNNLNNFQNPHPVLTQYPNKPLQDAVKIIAPTSFMHWSVTTQPLTRGEGRGVVTNIPFEQRVSEVTEYSAEYWLLFKGQAKYLSYTQTILMKLTIKGKKYVFPHLTCNTVTYCE